MKTKKKKKTSLNAIIKCAGGKGKMIKHLQNYIPETYTRYYEPFAGGMSFALFLKPKNALIADSNYEIINLYTMVRDRLADLKLLLDEHLNQHGEEHYYFLRNLDRDPASFNKLSELDRAARFLYINKTCFNGLTRYNRSGNFNVPMGSYKRVVLYEETKINAVSSYLLSGKRKSRNGQITLKHCDFMQAVASARPDSFIYFDPPYIKLNRTSSFAGYAKEGFKFEDHVRLKDCCDRLIDRGCQVMISNSNTTASRDLYSGDQYIIHEVESTRSVGAKGDSRGKISELIITSKYKYKEE